MSDHADGFTVGSPAPLAADVEEELAAAFGELVEHPVETESVSGLAGARDFIQLLADHETWAKFAGIAFAAGSGVKVVSWLADGLLGPTVKAGGEWIRDNVPAAIKARFQRLTALLSKARSSGTPTGVGLRIPKFFNNATIQIKTEDPNELARAIVLLSYHAGWLHQIFTNPPFRVQPTKDLPAIEWGRSPDMGRRIEIDAESRLYLPLTMQFAPVEDGVWIPHYFKLYPQELTE